MGESQRAGAGLARRFERDVDGVGCVGFDDVEQACLQGEVGEPQAGEREQAQRAEVAFARGA